MYENHLERMILEAELYAKEFGLGGDFQGIGSLAGREEREEAARRARVWAVRSKMRAHTLKDALALYKKMPKRIQAQLEECDV